jgi:hypothetical protein
LHQVQVLDFGEEESEFLFRFLPVFLLPEGFEENREVFSSGSEVSISINRCLTPPYGKVSFVVRLSTTCLWHLTKKPNKKPHLALSLVMNAAEVV